MATYDGVGYVWLLACDTGGCCCLLALVCWVLGCLINSVASFCDSLLDVWIVMIVASLFTCLLWFVTVGWLWFVVLIGYGLL